MHALSGRFFFLGCSFSHVARFFPLLSSFRFSLLPSLSPSLSSAVQIHKKSRPLRARAPPFPRFRLSWTHPDTRRPAWKSVIVLVEHKVSRRFSVSPKRLARRGGKWVFSLSSSFCFAGSSFPHLGPYLPRHRSSPRLLPFERFLPRSFLVVPSSRSSLS